MAPTKENDLLKVKLKIFQNVLLDIGVSVETLQDLERTISGPGNPQGLLTKTRKRYRGFIEQNLDPALYQPIWDGNGGSLKIYKMKLIAWNPVILIVASKDVPPTYNAGAAPLSDVHNNTNSVLPEGQTLCAAILEIQGALQFDYDWSRDPFIIPDGFSLWAANPYQQVNNLIKLSWDMEVSNR